MNEKMPKVLVVDDQQAMRLTLWGIIEDEGYDVIGVEDGYHAIAAVKENSYDLIFMDIMMPGINGVQTLREIKKISPSSVVVMMTGFAVENLVAEAVEEGAFAVIYKPFEIPEIIRTVEKVLKTVLILVVDDRMSDRHVVSEILTEKGYAVAEAGDGDEAVRMVRDSHFDVIFMDIRLPGKDGIETFKEVQAIDPDARVIFMTGYDLEDNVASALDAGAHPVAQKPLDMGNVLHLLEKMVDQKTA